MVLVIKYLTSIFLMVLLFVALSAARPRESTGKNSISGCPDDIIKQEICQRCAKMTKSNVAYPLCCSDQEGAYSFCTRYVNFGIHRR